MNELAALEAFLKETFLADAALSALIGQRVFTVKPKQAALFPCVVLSYVPGRDAVNTAGAVGRRIWLQPLYQVKAVCRGVPDFGKADAVAVELDRILAGLQDTFDAPDRTYRVTALSEQGAIRYAEPGDLELRWSGGFWKFIVESAD